MGRRRSGDGIRSGFSLPEMLVVLAIAAILISMSAPGLRSLLDSHRLTTVANEFLASLRLARSEAIRRGLRVDLVPAGEGSDWARGWMVFVDRNRNARLDPGEELIASHEPVAPGITIQSLLTDSSHPYIAYQETGRTRTDASRETPQFGSVLVGLENQSRKIVINLLGRARVCTPGAGAQPC